MSVDCGLFHPSLWILPSVAVWAILGVFVPICSAWSLGRLAWIVGAIAALGGAFSLYTLDWPATAWIPDTTEIIATICLDKTGGAFHWLEVRSVQGAGWPSLPWVAFNAVTNSLYGERVQGLWFGFVLVLIGAAYAHRWGRAAAVAAACALATNAPLLWVGRHFFGLELAVMQVLQLIAVSGMRRSRWWTPVSAFVTALCPLTYAATMLLTLYPLAAPWRRMVCTYLLAGLMLVPIFVLHRSFNQAPPFVGAFLGTSSYPGLARDACLDSGHERSLRSLWDAHAGINSSPGAPGTQTLSPLRLASVVLSTWVAPQWTLLGLAGIAPDLVGCGHGRSHRQMLVHVPLAMGLAKLAARLPWVGLPLAAAVFVDGAWQWWEWTQGAVTVPILVPLSTPACADRRLPCP